MAIILDPINYDINEVDACTTLAALQAIAGISPFTIAAARSQLETGQPQAFSNAAFKDYLTKLYNLPVTYSSLTTAEKTVLNVIREYIEPAPYLACCGTGNPEVEGVTFELIHKAGSTADYEARVQFTTPYSCDIVKVIATETSGTTPAATTPITINLLGCRDGFNTYSYLWQTFAGVPSGTYTFDLVFKDVDDVVVGSTLTKSVTF